MLLSSLSQKASSLFASKLSRSVLYPIPSCPIFWVRSCISVVAMTGAAIVIDDACAVDTIMSVKERLFAANRELPVRRQRLMYRPGPRGMEPLADDETLGGAGVAQDGSAELDVLLADLTEAELAALREKVWLPMSSYIAEKYYQRLGNHFSMLPNCFFASSAAFLLHFMQSSISQSLFAHFLVSSTECCMKSAVGCC